MKRIVFGLFCSVVTASFSQESCCYDCPAVREENVFSDVQGKLAAPRVGVCSVSLETDFLYWLPFEAGLEYAFTQDSDGLTPTGRSQDPSQFATTENGQFQRVNFDWGAGIRLKGGYRLPLDDWDLFLRWTRIHTHANDSVSINSLANQNIAAIWLEAEFVLLGYLRARSAEGKWNLSYNTLDLALGRSFYSSGHLMFTPNVGIRGFWINQLFSANYSGGDLTLPAQFKGKNDFDGAGIFGELGMKWQFLERWSLVGDFLGSFNFGRLKVGQRVVSQIQSFPPEMIRRDVLQQKTHPLEFCYQGAIGVQWEKFFRSCYEKKVTLCILYELVEWLHINQLRRFFYSDFGSITNYFPMDGNLGFQGISARLKVDF